MPDKVVFHVHTEIGFVSRRASVGLVSVAMAWSRTGIRFKSGSRPRGVDSGGSAPVELEE
jgi:hypothetical protein